MKSADNQIALVRKNKPAWQAGLLNGIGGKIEDGETPYMAMCREWKEETGNSHTEWTHYVTLSIGEHIIYFFRAQVDRTPGMFIKNDIGENIEIHDYGCVLLAKDKIENLSWLLPLAFEDTDNLLVWANDNRKDQVAA